MALDPGDALGDMLQKDVIASGRLTGARLPGQPSPPAHGGVQASLGDDVDGGVEQSLRVDEQPAQGEGGSHGGASTSSAPSLCG